jgi:hypothetical protein
MTPDYHADITLMGFGYSVTVPVPVHVVSTGSTSFTGGPYTGGNHCSIDVPKAEQGDEPGADRNGKRERKPKLPHLNRRQWWNR